MKLGLAGVNIGALSNPRRALQLARLAEELGYESLWTAEHIVLPDLPPGEHRWAADLPIVDSLVFLGYLAAATNRIRLATGILLLPQHEPRLLAKQVASLDHLCGGRFMLGIGVGNMEVEARAMGVPWQARGALTDEYLAALRALWTMPHPHFAGQHVAFDQVNAYPRPARPEGPPIIVGGHSEAAFLRAARYADGWYGVRLDLQHTREVITRLQDVQRRHRAPERPPLEISVLPVEPLTPETVEQYAELGVQRLVVWPPDDEAENVIRAISPTELRL